jgi:SAM-dependent methyltransferase
MTTFDPIDFTDLFENGMKRRVGRELPVPPGGVSLNLGSGNNPIKGCVNLDPYASGGSPPRNAGHPGEYHWAAPFLDYDDEWVSSIHAYHFLEHLDQQLTAMMLKEVQRVLKPGGVFFYCVPYAMSPIAYMDIDHRTFWTEETMRTLIESRGYYSTVLDKMQIQFQVIAGITSQNLAVLGTLRKDQS